MKKPVLAVFLLACASLVGCASSRISTVPVFGKVAHSIKAIALAPDGGLLADAVGVELSNKGFTVIDSASTSKHNDPTLHWAA